MNCFTDKAPLIARCSDGKDSLHGAEKKALLLGQLYVGPNSLWAQFVTVKVQLMYGLMLCSDFAGNFFCPTKIYMLKTPLHLLHYYEPSSPQAASTGWYWQQLKTALLFNTTPYAMG